MRFTLNWLKEYLDTNATLEDICNNLTMIGLEVEEIIDRSTELKDFIIAEIISAEQHPNADKLRVCKVNNGSEILQIVCGAPNARAGIKIVLAPIGAIVPANGMVIKRSKIRDVESEGMLCSASELKISEDHQGIMELNANAKPGDNFAKYAEFDDAVIELSITPNRGDCLGVYGIARELAAVGLGTLKNLECKTYNADSISPINVEIKSDLCPAYYGLYFSDIDNNKELIKYAKRLNAIGVKSHSPIVDITNYISYCYGRPSHAYDASKINGNIVVRKANSGEKFKSLADIEYVLNDELVIADQEKILALAGIIGGADSACNNNTKNIFIEIALFDSINVAITGRKLGIETDARYKFERKLDPLFLDNASNIFAEIIIEELGGKAHKAVKIIQNEFKPSKIQFNINKIESLGGMKIANQIICEILTKLGFTYSQNGEILDLNVPSWRNDISIEADIVEEVLRIYGYDKLELHPLSSVSDLSKPALTLNQIKLLETKRILAANGMDEVVTWSFMSQEKAAIFSPINESLILLNPISSELDYMRPSIIPNLLDIVKKNNARQFYNLALFEMGNIYRNINKEDQVLTIAGVRTGKTSEKNIYNDSREYDIFDVKADCINIIENLNFDFSKIRLTSEVPNFLHPTKSASLMLGKNIIGYFGELHPVLQKKMDLKNTINIFEIYPNNLSMKPKKSEKYEISDYQAVTRDFAFILPINQNIDEIIRLIKSLEKNLITEVRLFDIYIGDKVPEEKKSVALSVKIQASDRTLKDNEIEEICKNIISEIEKKFGGALR